MTLVSKELQALVTWTQSPDEKTFQPLIDALSTGDLMLAMTHLKNEPVGKLAWAVYGQRLGYFNLKISMVVADGKLNIDFVGEAQPIHHGAGFEVS